MDDLREKADAAIAAMPTGVKVKPLKWVEECDFHCAELEEAQSIFGRYSAFRAHGKADYSWNLEDGPDCPEAHDLESLEDAKAAAQADYEARILSALQPAPMSVAVAARVVADAIDNDMNTANRMIEAYVNVTMEMPAKHWLSQCVRALASPEGE